MSCFPACAVLFLGFKIQVLPLVAVAATASSNQIAALPDSSVSASLHMAGVWTGQLPFGQCLRAVPVYIVARAVVGTIMQYGAVWQGTMQRFCL